MRPRQADFIAALLGVGSLLAIIVKFLFFF
jgi:hypothetical protein